jgi:hypothetical protein
MDHRIEDVRTLAGKTVTLSFWAKGSSSGTIAANFSQDFGTSGSAREVVTAKTIDVSTSWNRYFLTFLLPSISGKTIGAGSSLRLILSKLQGTSYHAIWGAATFSGVLSICGIQLESGSNMTAFQTSTGTIQGELAACQRYYYTLPYNYNAERQNPYTDFLIMNTADQTSWARGVVQFPVTMRTSPSLQAPTAANYYILGSAGVLSVTSISIDNMTNASMAVVNAYRTGMSTGTTYFLRFAGNVTDYLRFSAEL